MDNNPKIDYDVVVVGAGPIGSYTANAIASSGYKVAVLERKAAAGEDICCTGIISAECFRLLDISTESIIRKAHSARFFLPSGRYIRLQSNHIEVIVADRGLLDKSLVTKAQKNGVSYFFSTNCLSIKPSITNVVLVISRQNSREFITARAVVLATGQYKKLHRNLGISGITNYAIGSQVEVAAATSIDEVEVYFNQQLAPGFFAWLVPLSGNRALAGMITRSHSKLKLKRFLESNFCINRISYDKDKIRQKVVPLKAVPHSYHNRVLIVGDAAGHVKPTTGGGIYLGICGAKIAAEVLINNLAKDTLSERDLLPYEKRWKSEMNREFLLGSGFRWFYSRLDNAQLEKLLARTIAGDMATKILNSPDLSFDHHSRIMLSCLRYCLYYPFDRISHTFTGKQSND